jgi:hypothetical protein
MPSRTPVSDEIRSRMWGLDDETVGGGHSTSWGELHALSTGDGPQLRPSAGGRYISLLSERPHRPPAPRPSAAPRVSKPAPAPAVQPSAQTICAMDRSKIATLLLQRGLLAAATEATEAARQLDRTVHIAAPEEPVGRWDGVDPRS